MIKPARWRQFQRRASNRLRQADDPCWQGRSAHSMLPALLKMMTRNPCELSMPRPIPRRTAEQLLFWATRVRVPPEQSAPRQLYPEMGSISCRGRLHMGAVALLAVDHEKRRASAQQHAVNLRHPVASALSKRRNWHLLPPTVRGAKGSFANCDIKCSFGHFSANRLAQPSWCRTGDGVLHRKGIPAIFGALPRRREIHHRWRHHSD